MFVPLQILGNSLPDWAILVIGTFTVTNLAMAGVFRSSAWVPRPV